jgi:hypothetical protein
MVACTTSATATSTAGRVRVLASAEQVRNERPGMERAAEAGLVKIHGTPGRAAGGVPTRSLERGWRVPLSRLQLSRKEEIEEWPYLDEAVLLGTRGRVEYIG